VNLTFLILKGKVRGKPFEVFVVPAATSRVVCFGVFEADLRAGEIRKGEVKIKIQEKPFQLLAVLLERPKEVVTREELRQRLWPSDTFVDFDHSLGTAVAKLRQALGDSAQNPRFVETVASRGYRFIAPVSRIDQDTGTLESAGGLPSPAAVSKLSNRVRWLAGSVLGLILGALLAAIVLGFNIGGARQRLRRMSNPPVRSLAVLPLANLSGDPQQDYFSDGMTDALISDLSKISALRVISRTSVMQYKGTTKPLPQIGRELNVDALLEGSVQRSGDRVRITAQLIEGETERHLWAESYEREVRDVLALETQVAQTVAREIRMTLVPAKETVLSERSAVDPRAYDAYLRGLYSFHRGRDAMPPASEELLGRSIEQFQQAIQLDPNYAQAYAALARSYHWLSYSQPELFLKSQGAARKAIALDDNIAEAHGALGFVAFAYEWNFKEAEKELQRALSLNPNYSEAHHAYGLYLAAQGRLDEAVVEFQRARELDPFTISLREYAGKVYGCALHYDLATREFQGLLQMEPNNIAGHLDLGVIHLSQGENEQALAEFQKTMELSGNDPRFLVEIAWAKARSGKQDEASNIRDQLLALPHNRRLSSLQMADLEAVLGNKEQAFQWLEKAFQARQRGILQLRCRPALASLHSDPRFSGLLQRIGLPP